ncbi:MAG: head-tail adaptor protein [Hyphomonadaceae bacterium]|nr:head-tail adaptor protein [Hyphomonadaceae bacterium]GIK50814.1 MAG: hypothetical protein BroJett013_35110 [Alphaproteobacteria bacterium]
MSEAIGALRARIMLQAPARVADEIGGAAILWTDRGEAWARIEALRADERAAFDGVSASASLRVVINRRADVRAGWRAVWGERVLRIAGVVDDGAPRITLVCIEERP